MQDQDKEVCCHQCSRTIRFDTTKLSQSGLIEEFEAALRSYKIPQELQERAIRSANELQNVFNESKENNSIDDPVRADRQVNATERFIEISAELLKIGMPLCNNCAMTFISFSERNKSKRTNRLQNRKEALQKATTEYRELLRRIESRIQESHENNESNEIENQFDASPEPLENTTTPLVPPMEGFDEEDLTKYPYNSPELQLAYQSLLEEEAQLEADLASIFEERAELVETAGILAAERRAVEEGEIIVQRASQDLQVMISDLSQAHGDVRLRTRDAYNALHNLVSASPIADLFPIELKSIVPTISGFSLGRTATDPVDWVEISAAFGQVALLLDTVRRRYNHTCSKLQILPRGAVSHIVRTQSNSKSVVLNLFRSDRVRLNLLGKQSQFDAGVEALLEFLDSLHDTIAQTDPRISDGWAVIDLKHHTIGGFSVKYSPEKEVDWTCAMRSLLFNCKKILLCAIHRAV